MADGTTQPAGLSYERRLDADGRWALSEGSRHFNGTSDVHATLRGICGRLNDMGIPYAVVGGMALFMHGLRRFTEDVGILVSRENLKRIHGELSGLGYVPLFDGSKNLRDTQSGVRIEFLLVGDYPGDGKQKPIAFPDPMELVELQDGIQFLNLRSVVELKLASGMTGTDRMKDLADVQELIKLLSLPADFREDLDAYVQPKFRELWDAAMGGERRFMRIWRGESLRGELRSIDDMISLLPDDAETLTRMRDDGVTLDLEGGTSHDNAYLVTTDPEVARKYDMHDESEFLG
jgi:hypothetical protein